MKEPTIKDLTDTEESDGQMTAIIAKGPKGPKCLLVLGANAAQPYGHTLVARIHTSFADARRIALLWNEK